MKKFLLVAAAFLLAREAYGASYTPAPSCESMGYTESASSCSGQYLACMFDKTKVLCLNAAPKVGDLKYSTNSSNHDGWLKCDGTQYSQTMYPELYAVIKNWFCHKYESREDLGYSNNDCELGKFAVPDYRGFFLRGINTYNYSSNTIGAYSSYCGYAIYHKGYCGSSTAFTTPWLPHQEQLPNITGTMRFRSESGVADGAFSVTHGNNTTAGHKNSKAIPTFTFNASSSNPIYDGSHVMPASYGSYIFIYAGDPK